MVIYGYCLTYSNEYAYRYDCINSNHDWFLHFFESAGCISNEDMQLLWARVLAGEMQKRGSFSFRTIEALRNMNREETLLFQFCSQLRVISPYGEVFLLSSEESFSFNENNGQFDDCITNESDWTEILSLAYEIGHERIAIYEVEIDGVIFSDWDISGDTILDEMGSTELTITNTDFAYNPSYNNNDIRRISYKPSPDFTVRAKTCD